MVDFNYMALWKRRNSGDGKMLSGEQHREGYVGGAQGIFRVVKLLCDTLMADAYHYTFVQSHRMYTTRSEP